MIKIICSIAITISLTACLKKRGCTDEDAINYNGDAKKSDKSCFYECTGNFYWKEDQYDEIFADSGSVFISVFLDGKFIGDDSLVNYYSSGGISCDDDEIGINFIDTNFYEYEEYKQLKVVDQNQKVLVNGPILIIADCKKYQLLY